MAIAFDPSLDLGVKTSPISNANAIGNKAFSLGNNTEIAYNPNVNLAAGAPDPQQSQQAPSESSNSSAKKPSIRSVADIKSKLMHPALTSHFECYFPIPPTVQSWLSANGLSFSYEITDKLTLSCSDASLPGSSFATHELNNDFTGVTQRHAYRRLYDDRADFTFYVDINYTQIRLFEVWMRYIVNEQITAGNEGKDIRANNYFYRINYPTTYKTNIFITKFEKDYGKYSNNTLVYEFVDAFPTQVNSMPVSYESSQLLKVTVSFAYDRYYVVGQSNPSPQQEPSQKTPAGIPQTPISQQQFGADSGKSFQPISQQQFGVDSGKLNLPSNFTPLSPKVGNSPNLINIGSGGIIR